MWPVPMVSCRVVIFESDGADVVHPVGFAAQPGVLPGGDRLPAPLTDAAGCVSRMILAGLTFGYGPPRVGQLNIREELAGQPEPPAVLFVNGEMVMAPESSDWPELC